MEQNNKFDIKKVRVHRTLEGTVFEAVAYYPRLINSTVKITNIRQVELNIRSVRVAGITLLLMALAVAYTMLGMESQTPIPILSVVVLLLIEILVFSILTHKAR